MDNQIKKLLTVSITLKPYLSEGARGKPQYGTAKTLYCYPSKVFKVVHTDKGDVLVSQTVLYFDADADALAIDEKDQITMSDLTKYPVFSKDIYYDGETGEPDLVEVGI